MTKIPPKLRAEMAEDKYYKKCCLAHLGGCSGRIEWHHSLIFAGRQLQEKYAIVPACHEHHYRVSEFNEQFIHVALNRATEGQLRAIGKATDYVAMRDRLNKKYG